MKIILNGKNIETNFKTIYDLTSQNNIKNKVFIVNGYQTNKNIDINNNDNIVIIEKKKFPNINQLESMLISRNSPEVFYKIKEAKVIIIGLGGLGSNIAIMLTRIGINNLLLIDFDTVDPSNINRQHYNMSHLGLYKTDALKKQILEINPFSKAQTLNIKIDNLNIDSIILDNDYNIVCESVDDPEIKAFLINKILLKYKTKKIVASSGMAGYFSSNKIQTKKIFDNLYVCGDFISESKINNGLMAPRVQICAGHQANMILRLIMDLSI